MHAVALAHQDVTLPQLPLEADLFGRVVSDHFAGRPGDYYLRRDDNLLERDSSARYFRSWEQMPAHHRCLLNHAYGHILDIGAGAGQHALALQERGLAVTAIDASPLAIDVCRQRGVREAQVMDANALHFPPEQFDTVLLMGNTLGIAGTLEGLRRLLFRLHGITRPGGQILSDFTDYTTTHDPSHLRYHRWNNAHGRYPGSIRLRVEYNGMRGPDFDWLLIEMSDLRKIGEECGWHFKRVVQVNASGATYAIGMERV